jgi:hypothetical protein
MNKQSYEAPELIVHGDVEQITQASNLANSDVQAGTPGTAFPVKSV